MAEPVVGPVVGPISSISSNPSDARYTRDGTQYDFAIAGLPFASAISDERPYARETAEFKKTQVDQSNAVGDQSLTGYWTRGQSSFHRGAGINYYEILDGETVPNRFHDATNVEVWTPGQVTLKKVLTSITAVAVKDAVKHNGAILTLSPAGAAALVTYAGSPTSKPSTTAGAFSSICSDGTNAYSTNGNKIEQLVGAGSFAVLWTHHVGGRTWASVFWAKDRLWAVDNTGEWYTLTTAGGTTAGGDILWTSRKSGTGWSLADAESGVFLAFGNTLYSSTLDTSTTTPTLNTPFVAAVVGAQETIANIGAYSGYVSIGSDVGLRMGQIQNGGVVIGNLIVEASFTYNTRVAYRNNLIQVAGTIDTDEILYELNPLEQVSTLQGAYAPVRLLGSSTTTPHGSLVLPDGRVVTFSSTGLSLEGSDYADTGFIETGFHRFGTLEPKDFRTVSVRVEGVGGTVAVEKVLRNGAASSLVTLGVANFYDNEIPLNLAGPSDYIGLRFTLEPDDAGNVPTLLGYQLRALPAPKRQRLIQIPLRCFDIEKIAGTEYGRDGWAWERLSTLEELEANSSVVTYQDFRINETATVSIESIQHQGRTPPSQGSQNFGGYIVVTLRKVV